ncbi:MAG: 2TM domain-containing protein [Deltaproteobacteria bacterium]|nr:2TM domain-containing protein [Deltaproteobacteria bacterium]NND28605.1 2TM domain-containing protein [Myxococcales bacterium]MBT8463219.1 2TM domain-containing protein [Deltaproteobacteria bacterium]MBT8481357.1 2TM domain-containing protein [Deltaproteobacteria bacterium]NNK06975.1 2TM domain-containing protein [Myxococcales bacterium]
MKQYSRQEVEEVLRRALETQPLETLSHKDLIDSAVEAGIDAADVEAAARQIEEEREVLIEEDLIVNARKKRFLQSIYTYVVVNAGLFVIDIMSGPGWWVQWVLAGWGIALALGARRALMPDRDRLRARARRRIARRSRGKWEKQVRKEVDRAIQVGVDALVEAASRKLSARQEAQKQPGRRVRVEHEDVEVAEVEVIEGSGGKQRS